MKQNKLTMYDMIDNLAKYACCTNPAKATDDNLMTDLCTYVSMCAIDESGNLLDPDKVYLNGRKIIQEHFEMKNHLDMKNLRKKIANDDPKKFLKNLKNFSDTLEVDRYDDLKGYFDAFSDILHCNDRDLEKYPPHYREEYERGSLRAEVLLMSMKHLEPDLCKHIMDVIKENEQIKEKEKSHNEKSEEIFSMKSAPNQSFDNSVALSVIQDELDSFTMDDLVPNASKIQRIAMSIHFGDEKIFIKSENRKVFYDVAMSNLESLYDHYDESADIDVEIKINARDEDGKSVGKIKVEYRFDVFEDFLDLLQEHFLCTPLFEDTGDSSDESNDDKNEDSENLCKDDNPDMITQIVNSMDILEKEIHRYERMNDKILTGVKISKISITVGNKTTHVDDVSNDDEIQNFIDSNVFIDPDSDKENLIKLCLTCEFKHSKYTEDLDERDYTLQYHNVNDAEIIWTILNSLPDYVKTVLLYDSESNEENADADDSNNEAKTYWSEFTAMSNNCETLRILDQTEKTTGHSIRNAKIIKIHVETKDGNSVVYTTGVESDDDLKEIVKLATQRGIDGKPFIVRVWVETINGVKGSYCPKYVFEYVFTDAYDILKCVDKLPNKIKSVLYFQ